MSDRYVNYKNYENDIPWLEIIRYRKKKVVTPIERAKRELEEIIELRGEGVKSFEVDTIVPKLRKIIADVESGITEYELLLGLFKRISILTGELEIESKVLKRIIENEKKHRKELEYIIKDLTK